MEQPGPGDGALDGQPDPHSSSPFQHHTPRAAGDGSQVGGPVVGGAPPTERGAFRAIERPAWPTAMGVISIVLGSLGILSNLWGLVGMVLMRGISGWLESSGAGGGVSMNAWTTEMLVVMGANSVVSLGVSIWLLVAGIGVVRRRRWSIGALRGWAWVRVCMVLLQTGLTYWVQHVQMAAMSEEIAAQGGGQAVAMFGWMGPLIGVLTALFALLWGMAWPVFCLIWLGRARVRAHSETWGVAV